MPAVLRKPSVAGNDGVKRKDSNVKVVVLLGGDSPEREVSLVTGRGIMEALRRRGHEVSAVDPSLPMDQQNQPGDDVHISEEPPKADSKLGKGITFEWVQSDPVLSSDIVFNALHGGMGEDGTIQAVLEMARIPYTGSGVLASALAMNKDRAKALFRDAGVPTAPHILIRKGDAGKALERIKDELGFPVVVKPNDQGSSVGFSFVPSSDGLDAAFERASEFSDEFLVEKYIEGREVTVAVLDGEALPVVEIVPEGGFYDYKRKYTKGTSRYIVPAPLDEQLAARLKEAGVKAYEALSCRDYARVDFRLSGDGGIFCLEVNTLPGMTELSLVPMAAREAGMEFDELVERIAMMAYSRKDD